MNCLLFGANPDELGFMSDTDALPAERGFDCDQSYAQALHAYRWMLDTCGRKPGSMIPFNGIVVSFDETRTERRERVRQWIATAGLVQELSARVTEFFPWPQSIPMRFANCPGSADAYYNRNVGEIVICYELLDVFLERTKTRFPETLSWFVVIQAFADFMAISLAVSAWFWQNHLDAFDPRHSYLREMLESYLQRVTIVFRFFWHAY